MFVFKLAYGQGIEIYSPISVEAIISHFKNNGLTYSIEGIWLRSSETEIKAFNKGEMYYNNLIKDDSKNKIAFLNIDDEIHMYHYSEKTATYTPQKKEINLRIKPTPNKSIFLYTLPSQYVDGTRFKEVNAEIVVENNLMKYTTTTEPENAPDIKVIFIRETVGYKISPTEKDLLIKDQKGFVFNFPITTIGDMHFISLEIGGDANSYLIDSGASYVTITSKMEESLRNMGVLRESDYYGSVDLELADKSIVKLRKVVLPVVKMGNQTILNVEAVISDGSLLLGRSLINKFKSWNLDNYKSILTITTY